MATKLQPIGSNILVKAESEQTTASGIVLPDTVDKDKPQRGKIVALGTGRLNPEGKVIPFNVKIGDTVLFKKYAPDEIELDGEEYLIMQENDILAIIQ